MLATTEGATVTTTERHLSDEYLTPKSIVATLRPYLPERLGLTLDPAAGDGVFQEVLGDRAAQWFNIDIRPEAKAQDCVTANYLVTQDRHWTRDGRPVPMPTSFDTIVTNPPFSLITEFLLTSFTVLNGWDWIVNTVRGNYQPWPPGKRLAFFARLALLEGTGRLEDLWQHPTLRPTAVVTLPRRPKFPGFATQDRWAYAWFLWGDVPVQGLQWVTEPYEVA